MNVVATGYNVAIVLDEKTEGDATLEGQKGVILLARQRGTLPQMRVGTIASVGPGIWKTIDDVFQRIPLPSRFRVGMKVCLPPFNLTETVIPGLGRVVFTNPHSIIGEVLE